MKTRTRTKMLLLLGVLLFGFTVSAWSQKVSLNFNNEKVEKILSSIKAQTGMGLVFSDQLIDVNRKISIQVKDASLDEALSKLLAGTKVTFEIKNNKIYFIEKKADQQSGSRKKKVSGVVKDATGEPIIGANVVEKGVGTNGVITNLDGEFTLEVPENASLIISYIGYLQQDVSTKGKDAFNIIMKEDTKTLDEVVVVGYGVQKKVNLTGAVAAVDSKSLQNRPVTNVSNAIQGLLPGVTVISGTGQPGNDNTTIRVRGVGTLNNSNPMYVVDGLPVSSINEVDPSDIENISVLKDASSAAIYGSRGANGVILIKTKEAQKTGKVNVQFSASFGIQQMEKKLDVLTPAENASLPWGARLMTLECGMRFLADFLQGDVYFKTTYPEHNLVRARTQFRLVKEMEEQFDQMQEIVETF